MTENDIPTKLLWVDLEMTGLDPTSQKIIEIAAVVTDFELVEQARYEAVVGQPSEVLDEAEDWPKEHMQALFEQVASAEKNDEIVQDEFASFIRDNWGGEPAVLAGNSIHQDRRFIRQWWPVVESALHYRMLDVSTLKIWVQGTSGEQYLKSEKHRALDDIEESIDELKWCLEQLKR